MNQQIENRMKTPGPKKILACDGGGILGLMSVEILAKIEADLRAKLGKDQNFVLADYFDFVCGTSTGAIIAACIASGMAMDQVRQFYIDSGKQMFDKASVLKRLQYSYNDEPLAKLLRQAFDQQLKETDAKLGSANLKSLLMMVMRVLLLQQEVLPRLRLNKGFALILILFLLENLRLPLGLMI